MSEQITKCTSTDLEIAMFVFREWSRLRGEHRRFLDSMSTLLNHHRDPTEAQRRYMHSLFRKLGGKVA
jgi:hypothetical protein